MKDNEELMSLFSNPRLNATTALAIVEKNEEILQMEFLIEMILNQTFETILLGLNDGDSHINISFPPTLPIDIKLEAINRLGDLGYVVKMAVDSDEEVEHLNGLAELAEDDPTVGEMIDEMYESSDEYVVFWDKESLGYGEIDND